MSSASSSSSSGTPAFLAMDFNGDRVGDFAIHDRTTGLLVPFHGGAATPDCPLIPGISVVAPTGPGTLIGTGVVDLDGNRVSDFAVAYRNQGTISFRTVSASGVGDPVDLPDTSGEAIPAWADLDGDGAWNAAVFDSGIWRWVASGPVMAIQFGLASDFPVAGRYLANVAEARVAVVRKVPVDGGVPALEWYASDGGMGLTVVAYFGLADDQVLPADYDGDGVTDVAVYRPESRELYIRTGDTSFDVRQLPAGPHEVFPCHTGQGLLMTVCELTSPQQGNWTLHIYGTTEMVCDLGLPSTDDVWPLYPNNGAVDARYR
ncbi:MAG: hypothetical protein AB2A00_34180 [Myxococcota bacterium]